MAEMELELICEGAISGPGTHHTVNNVAFLSYPTPECQPRPRKSILSQAAFVPTGERSAANISMEAR